MQINLQWVPDHMNIYDNKKADEKVKLGSKLRTVHHKIITSLSFLKRKIIYLVKDRTRVLQILSKKIAKL